MVPIPKASQDKSIQHKTYTIIYSLREVTSLSLLDRAAVIRVAMERLHRPYLFGAKWPLNNLNPQGPVDCSGFSRWCLWRGKVEIPDGSQEQYDISEPTNDPMPGDLGFFGLDIAGIVDTSKIHHIGIYNGANVIEARGEPYNQVILRPSAKWEAWKEFTGWRRIKGVTN